SSRSSPQASPCRAVSDMESPSATAASPMQCALAARAGGARGRRGEGMRAMRRAMIVATAGAMAFMFGSCSNSKGGCDTNPMGPGCTTTTTTTQPVQTRSVIRTDSCTGIGVNFLCFFDPLTTSQRGDMDVTVDWTFPEDSIQVMVSNGPCTLEQINASTCPMIGTSTASNLPKPRLLTIRGVAAGTYQLYVGNRG